MSGDIGLRMIGKDPAGLGKGISVTEEGVINVKNKVDNGLLAEGNLKAGEPLEVPPTKAKATMIALKGFGGSEDNVIKFEQNVDGLGYLPWKDGQGNAVELNIKGNEEGVFGGFQGFPYFNGGRLLIEGDPSDPENISAGLSSESYSLKVFPDVEGLFNGKLLSAYKNSDMFYTVQLSNPEIVRSVRLRGSSMSSGLRNFKLEGSSNNIDWNTLVTGELPNTITSQTFSFENNTSYTYYRLHCIDNYGSNTRIRCGNVRLFLGDDITEVQNNQTYFAEPLEVFPNPNLISPSDPFNNSLTNLEAIKGVAFTIDFGVESLRKIDKVSLLVDDSGASLNEFKIKGSNNNVDWDVLLEASTARDGTIHEFEITNKGSYRYYRLLSVSNHSNDTWTSFQNINYFDEGSLYQVKIQEVL